MDEDPVLAAVRKQSEGLKRYAAGLANIGRVDEYQFGLHQRILVDLVNRRHTLSRRDLLNAHFELLSVLVAIAHRDNLPVSFELATILRDCESEGITIPTAGNLRGVRSLKSFPTEAPVVHSAYVDEAGTPKFEELTQPVLTLVGVLVRGDN